MTELLSGGIDNPSNTCYLSCSLQIIFRYKPFMNKINSLLKEFPDIKIFQILSDLHKKLINSNTPLDPTPLIDFMKIDKTKQQDICEFLATFLNLVIESLPEDRRNELSDILRSKLTTSVKDVTDNVFFYTIPVDPKFTVNERLFMSLSEHSEVFLSKPQIFLIQLQRMLYNKGEKQTNKVSYPMRINFDLDLTNYQALNYKLFAVIVHIGSGLGGHYIAYLRDSKGWLYASDRSVKPVEQAEVAKNASSSGSPAYLLCFVTDIDNDVLTLRNPLKNDVIPLPGLPKPRAVNLGKIKCAFNPNKSAKFSETVLPNITVVTQFFDQSTMEFKEADENIYSSIDEIKQMIRCYESDNTVIMQFGYIEDVFSDYMPPEVGHYDTPLYIMFQNRLYKVFNTNPYQHNMPIKVTYRQKYVGFSFDSYFSAEQRMCDVNEYITRQMRNLFQSRHSYCGYLKFYGDLFIPLMKQQFTLFHLVTSMKMINNESDADQNALEVYFIEEKTKPPFKTTKDIQVFFQSRPTEAMHTMKYDVAVRPSLFKMVNNEQMDTAKSALFAVVSQTRAIRLTDPIDIKVFYQNDDIRLISSYTYGVTALFVLTFDGEFVENFFFDVCETFEETVEKLKQTISYTSFIIIFNLNNENGDIITQGNPKEILQENPDGYFSIIPNSDS